jgi:hypothetical protein
VLIRLKVDIPKGEIERFIQSIHQIKKEDKNVILDKQKTQTYVENIYGTAILETTFPGKLYLDGNWFSDVTAGQKITIEYLREGEHTLFIKTPDDQNWEKVFYIRRGVVEKVVAQLSEYQSAMDFNLGVGLDLGPIFAYVKKEYPIDNRGSFLFWQDIGSRKDCAYLTDKGRILICSQTPIRSFADIDEFRNTLTVILLDYVAKVQVGIDENLRNQLWDWKRVVYAHERNIFKRVLAWHPPTETPYKLPWTIKIPNINIESARIGVIASTQGGFWAHVSAKYYFDNNFIGEVKSGNAIIKDITDMAKYGTHTFNIFRDANKLCMVTMVYFGFETINKSSPEKIEIYDGEGKRFVDSTPCWHIEDLELPK